VRELGIPFDKMQLGPIADGFLTDSGRFVSRYEAQQIANAPRQGGAALHSSETLMTGGQRVAASDVRTGATASGLPGGQGIWGERLPRTDAELLEWLDGVAWPRADSLVSLNAGRLRPDEIQAALARQWGRGHDAVELQDFVTPGGTRPEPVIVVPNANQLRSPRAAFDPARKFSPDLMAAIAGGGVVPGAVLGQILDRQTPQWTGAPDDASAILGSGQPLAMPRD
jgi:hypothetical protein